MEITLQTVRDILRTSFGRDSFVAAFINKVAADRACPTASINVEGVMRYNPDFVERHVACPAELFCLVVHELMHPLFGHFVYHNGPLENISGDLVINAVISQVYAEPSQRGSLFRKLYKPLDLEGLLRPDSDMHQSRYNRLYQSFYGSSHTGHKLSTGEVIQTLKVLTPVQSVHVATLLGTHGSGKEGSASGRTAKMSADIMARIAQDLRRAAQKAGGRHGGDGAALFTLFMEVLKGHLGLKRALLDRFTTQHKVDKFRRVISQPRIGVSPIPIRPSKRDFVLLAAGMPPFHYHNHAYRAAFQEQGLAIYLDVSGSVNEYLPKIIALLRSLRTNLTSIFLFSNKAVEVPFKTLLAGHVQTTYGTDFDCIADSILERSFDKAVILTDGHARLDKEKQEELKARKTQVLTVLFGGKDDCDEFAPLGDVVQLTDVTE